MFHSNLEISLSVVRNFLKFDQELFFRWSKYFSSPVTLPSTVACQFTWFNKHVKIDNKNNCFHSLSNNNLNFPGKLFDFDDSIKFCECLKNQFRIKNNMQFHCWEIKHAIPQLWKDNIKNIAKNLSNLSIQDRYLMKCNRILNLEKLNRLSANPTIWSNTLKQFVGYCRRIV